MMKIKKGDTVVVTVGKDRGKRGKVLRVSPREGRVFVEGAAQRVRHRRARRSGEKGQRVTMPGPIAIGNVRIVCGACGKAARVGFHKGEGGKQRMCKKCGVVIA